LSSLAADASSAVAQHRKADRGALALELRRELDWIPLKALRKDRKERYATPADMARDIKNYLEGRPLEAGPESAMYRFRKAVRRNKGLVAAGAAVTAALVLGLVVFAVQTYRFGVQRDAAVAARNDAVKAGMLAEQERHRAETIIEFIQTALKAGDPNQGGRRDMHVTEAIATAVQEVNAGAFNDQPATESALRLTLAEILNGNTKSTEALPMAQKGLEIARTLHPAPEDHADVARGMGVVGSYLHTLGRYDEALPLFQSALDMDKRLHPAPNEDHADTVQALRHMGMCLDSMGKQTEALPQFEAALAMSRRLDPGDSEATALLLGNIGYCLNMTGRAADALPQIEEGLAMDDRLHPGDHHERARAISQLAFCLQSLGRNEEALAKHKEALEMRRRMFKGDQPALAN